MEPRLTHYEVGFLPRNQHATVAGKPRVACKSRDLKRVPSLCNPGKAAGALNFQTVVEDLDPNVITADAVRPMDDCVDESLQPRILRK
jgi:hypothetical protein